MLGRWCVAILAVSAACQIAAAATKTSSKDSTTSYSPAAIDAAIDRAQKFLYAKQKDGNWETIPARDADAKPWTTAGGQWGGSTAAATYALLVSGEPHQESHIADGITFLKKADLIGVYALAMRCQVWLALPQTPETRQLMARDAAVLRSMMKTQGAARGFDGYINDPGGDDYSHSRGHYAVVGEWAAAQAGIEISDEYWSTVEQAWLRDQDASGGWSYYAKPNKDHPLTPGMTAAGVATLFVTQEYLHDSDLPPKPGNPRFGAIDKGMHWLADNFDKIASNQRTAHDYPIPTLYAVERVGVASGYKFIGTHDWYQRGASWLLKKQNTDGGFGSVADSSLALLFLARGREPLAMSKLDYTVSATKPPQWNQRPRDAANLSRWIGRQIEHELNWQIVDLNASVTDLHDAPILYISGSELLNLRPQDKMKLKQFTQEGGLILGNADNGALSFSGSFRHLGGELFPDYEFRELPADHPIYTNEQFPRAKWKSKPSVLGLSNGVRELMLLVPQQDPARTWQQRVSSSKEELWQLGANVLLYSVDKKNLRNRGESYTIARDNSAKAKQKATIARIQYSGNWDPEPLGWTRLANLLHNQRKIDIETKPVKLAPGALSGMKIAHLTGTTKFKFTDAERTELRAFLDAGGTLIIDAAGGSSEFAAAAEAELGAMFPDQLKPLPPEHAIFTISGKMPPIRYREYAQKMLGSLKDIPRLQGIESNGRTIVFYSREDLTAGLVGESVDGVIGYEPATATELMSRIVQYSSPEKPGKKSPATTQ